MTFVRALCCYCCLLLLPCYTIRALKGNLCLRYQMCWGNIIVWHNVLQGDIGSFYDVIIFECWLLKRPVFVIKWTIQSTFICPFNPMILWYGVGLCVTTDILEFSNTLMALPRDKNVVIYALFHIFVKLACLMEQRTLDARGVLWLKTWNCNEALIERIPRNAQMLLSIHLEKPISHSSINPRLEV